MGKHILITGGAGFIGSHLADELLAHGYRVRALDNLSPQVHRTREMRPAYLNPEIELMVGDVRDANAVEQALDGIDAVYHFAAAVGVGQSMYAIAEYTSTNNVGTAVLLEALANHPVERLIVASSMSIYGEGAYCAFDGQSYAAQQRSIEQLQRGEWDIRSPQDGSLLQPIPTPESKHPDTSSVYALSKLDQERLCLMVGQAYHIPTVALRFFNAYGPRQSLSNPYTGVLAIFSSSYLSGEAPNIFEDGLQQRDFVHVRDLARACRLALETPAAAGHVFNVGSGQPQTVCGLAAQLADVLGKQHLEPRILNQYRVGDIRHCYADISKAQWILGYEPQVPLRTGLEELAAWLDGQMAVNGTRQANEELTARGLVV
jgi:dTDP-L-rhamnose 4-epimerase